MTGGPRGDTPTHGITLGVAALALGLAGCADDHLEVRSLVLYYGEAAYLEAPDSLPPGVSAPITAWTFRSCQDRPGPTHVTISDQVVLIEPYDSVPVRAPTCPDAQPAPFGHTVFVDVPQPGPITLRLVGRGQPGDTTVTLDRILIVH